MRLFLILLSALILAVIPDSKGQTIHDENYFDSLFSTKGEIYFTFLKGNHDLANLSRIISIDRVQGESIFAYANRREFAEFLKHENNFVILPHPGDLLPEVKMLDQVNTKEAKDWDFYPTYNAYIDMMYQFQANYPDLCQVFSIGQSVQGRQLMMAKISKNVSIREPEPQFLYTGTIHGDETTGYVLLLRLIDYLLTNYGSNPKVTNLLNNCEIWINPLSNPDGTYKAGNHTVNGATRYNANNVDLNRNYPDPEDGPHPDGNPWQPETLAFMQLAEQENFVMSANTHGGAEVLNYPWDTWAQLHADNSWWIFVCRQYVDTVHLYSPTNYMNGFNNGITNGFQWYTISGGRQDFMNYFHYCREVTMELSDTKLLPPSQLPSHWNWNYRSLLNYIEQSLYGIRGIVTSQATGQPLRAKVFIQGHDIDNSFVYTDPRNGFYQRLLDNGTYNLTFSAPGHYPLTINNVVVSRYNTVTLNVALDAGTLAADFTASATSVAIGTPINFYDQSYGAPVSWQWEFPGGTPSSSSLQNPQNIVYQTPGSYSVTLTVWDSNGNSHSVTKQNYITVNAEFFMNNQTLTVCTGLFYDSGGPSANYSNNENFVMTFIPATPGGKIKVQFLSFDVEYHSSCNYDWLKIYNGNSTSSPLIGTYCGTNSPGTIQATNPAGALTFQFHSDYSITKTGWKAQISCIPAGLPPQANFTANQTQIYKGESVQFTDLSTNNPTSWKWFFEGGTPTVSFQPNPVITYNEIGEFDVKLVVQNNFGKDSLLIENFIKVDSAIGITHPSKSKVSVIPNPAKHFIMISGNDPINTIEIIDITGNILLSKSKPAGINQTTMDVSDIPNGVYILRISYPEYSSVIKLTIMR